jgi:hypothetical protein
VTRKLTKEQRDEWREKLPKGPPRYGYQATMEMMLDDLDEADRELAEETYTKEYVMRQHNGTRKERDELRAKLAEVTNERDFLDRQNKEMRVKEDFEITANILRAKLAVARGALEKVCEYSNSHEVSNIAREALAKIGGEGVSMDLEAAEKLAAPGSDFNVVRMAQTIRDLVAEVKELRKPLVFIGDTQAEHPAVDELRAKLAEAVGQVGEWGKQVGELRAKLAVARETLELVARTKDRLGLQLAAREALDKLGGE